MKLLVLLALGLVGSAAAAQPTADTAKATLSQAGFFADESPVLLTLKSDFRQLKRKKQKGQFQPGTATLIANGERYEGPLQLAARGEFRRQNCAMPSLMANFKTGVASPLSKLKKLKMVCGCREGQANEEYLLKEYLTYRIYNLLTDFSFRVRLAKVEYVDEGNGSKSYSQYAFFVEDLDALARRNACTEYKKLSATVMTQPVQQLLVNVFQFMIGNLDWSIPNRHNIKLVQLRTDSAAPPYTVPYDFDFCGLVNAPYAFPQEMFEVERVTDRLYRGRVSKATEVEAVLHVFENKKENIYTLIREFAPLAKKQREDMLRFLDGFYSILQNQRDVQEIFIEATRKN